MWCAFGRELLQGVYICIYIYTYICIYIYTMEKAMETTLVYRGYIGIMEKKVETTT